MNQNEELLLMQYFFKFSKQFVLLINNYYVNQAFHVSITYI
jgi:hypothetical protein